MDAACALQTYNQRIDWLRNMYDKYGVTEAAEQFYSENRPKDRKSSFALSELLVVVRNEYLTMMGATVKDPKDKSSTRRSVAASKMLYNDNPSFVTDFSMAALAENGYSAFTRVCELAHDGKLAYLHKKPRDLVQTDFKALIGLRQVSTRREICSCVIGAEHTSPRLL
jgi:hypothetical protein